MRGGIGLGLALWAGVAAAESVFVVREEAGRRVSAWVDDSQLSEMEGIIKVFRSPRPPDQAAAEKAGKVPVKKEEKKVPPTVLKLAPIEVRARPLNPSVPFRDRLLPVPGGENAIDWHLPKDDERSL